MSYQELELTTEDDGYYDPVGDPALFCDNSAPDPLWYVCTRRTGHNGPHAAHGFSGDQFATWDNQPRVIERLLWCDHDEVVLGVGSNHLEGCLGNHYQVVVGDEVVKPPHKHTPQVMKTPGGVPVSVTCTGVDGCGYNENLNGEGWR